MSSLKKPIDLRKIDGVTRIVNNFHVKHLENSGVYSFPDKKKNLFESSQTEKSRIDLLEIFTSDYHYPEIFISEVSDCIVGPKPEGLPRYWPIFSGDYYIWNTLSSQSKNFLNNQGVIKYFNDSDQIEIAHKNNILHIGGKCVWLYTFDNLDHLLRETLPTCIALENAGEDLKNLTFVTPHISEDIIQMLILAGIPRDKILQVGNRWLSFDRLIVSCFSTFGHLHTPTKYYKKISRKIVKSSDLFVGGKILPASKNIYISRRLAKQRRILNEEEVEAVFKQAGFLILDPGCYSKVEQAKIFSKAEVVVGPHGMGFANAIFSENLKALIEIMPTDWNRVSYYRTAQLLGANYGCYWIDPININGGKNKEYYLDVSRFVNFVDENIKNLQTVATFQRED